MVGNIFFSNILSSSKSFILLFTSTFSGLVLIVYMTKLGTKTFGFTISWFTILQMIPSGNLFFEICLHFIYVTKSSSGPDWGMSFSGFMTGWNGTGLLVFSFVEGSSIDDNFF